MAVHDRIREAYEGCKYSLDPNRPRFKNMKLLAQELDVSVYKLRRWICGIAEPSFSEMANFAFVTCTSLDWLAAGGDHYGFYDDIPETWDLMGYPEWWTAKELATLKLPSLPSRTSSIEFLLERSFMFKGRFGGPKGRRRRDQHNGWRYHFQTLPMIAQCELQDLRLEGKIEIADFV